MIAALRRWLTFVLEVRLQPRPRPLAGRGDGDLARYLQRRAAQAAHHHPMTTPVRRARPLNQEGFQ
ncbi:hypothetical protein [Caulobacter soli]|uniref:hypothetical protein n=1 Tax=Caulobacter soli TaxID=2708539 RepID=UPI0013EC8613|nr:hypothetical protein [Caulobacter soli]